MPIGAVIREKRRGLGLTQEQMAALLGVSAPAVNKWERGATYPDFSLISPLARLLGVDLNTLLCFDAELSEQEIAGFCQRIGEAAKGEGLAAGFALAAEQIRKYPSCGALIHACALTLDGALVMADLDGPGKAGYEAQVLALYERALEAGDDKIRANAAFMLASKYTARGEYGRAGELLALVPEPSAADRRTLQASLLLRQDKLEEAAALLERKLLGEANDICLQLGTLSGIARREGDPERAGRLADLARQSAERFGLWGYMGAIASLEEAVARWDAPATLALLEEMLSCVFKPWEPWTTDLYRHIPGKAWQNPAQWVLPPLLRALESDPKYEFLWHAPDFRALIARYRARCAAALERA